MIKKKCLQTKYENASNEASAVYTKSGFNES